MSERLATINQLIREKLERDASLSAVDFHELNEWENSQLTSSLSIVLNYLRYYREIGGDPDSAYKFFKSKRKEGD